MIRNFFAITLVLLFTASINANVGDWKIHLSYHDATKCEVVGNKIYVLASGSLFTYNKEDGEIYTYDKLNELSDYDISHIKYCKDIDALIIIYKNANIDILYSNDYVYNISDFKTKTIANKTINNIDITGSTAYISTNFGVVVLNLEKMEFTNTYNLKLNVRCCYNYNDNLYIGTDEGVYKGSMKDNLLDKSKWNKINDSKVLSINDISNKLIFVEESKGISTIDENNGNSSVFIANGNDFKYLYKYNNQIYVSFGNEIFIMNNTTDYSVYATSDESNYLAADGNIFWNCKGIKGLVASKIADKQITDGENYIVPNSPVRNYCEFLKFVSNEKLLVAGGNINYFGKTFYPGTLCEYDYKNKKWFNLPEETVKNVTGEKYENLCSIDEDPREPGHYFASSFGRGLYEFRGGEFVAQHSYMNSPLQSAVTGADMKNYVRVSRVQYDTEGNLWVVNDHAEDIIKVLKNDGNWISLHYDDIANFKTIVNLLTDSRGWLWATSMRSDAGIFCAKTNNTLFDTSDDLTNIWLSKFTNQDGISYTIYMVYDICEDKNGTIWVGTDNGLFIIDNPEVFFNDGIFTQIKVPRNDGSGLADYLFSGARVTAINIDGANRKWIGTENNGIYLISADGQETIHHFDTENSMLPSNSIKSIAVNKEVGEVFIGTSGGMVSYMSDATEPEENLKESLVHAFPNPVKASYSGNISIVGLTLDCEVKIVDVAGYLITEGVSTGGMFTWDGRNASGEKVSSGVYYVLTYDANGDEGVATKILITR